MLFVKKPDFLSNQKLPELLWCWGQRADPYDDLAEIPDECYHIGLLYFARSPGSANIWVEFSDLPDATAKALRERMLAEPGCGPDYFDAARLTKVGSDKDHVSKMASYLTDAQLTMTIRMYEAWYESAFHQELEARRSRAEVRLGLPSDIAASK